MNSRKQFDIENGVITNIKPYEIVAFIVRNFKIFGKGNVRDEDAKAYVPMYWYASSKEEAQRIKDTVSEEISKETIDGNIIIRHLPVIVIDVKAKRISENAGVDRGIEKVIIYDGVPAIEEAAFDENTKIISIKSKQKTKKQYR